jgi:hypothetical protein
MDLVSTWPGCAALRLKGLMAANVAVAAEVAMSCLRNESNDIPQIGCPTSGVAQRAMREAAPHARGVSKARELEEGRL